MVNPHVSHDVLGPWTIEDLASTPDDGQRYEIFDGSLLVTPPPDTFHGITNQGIVYLLYKFAPPELRVLGVGIGVRMRQGRSLFIPDAMVVPRAAMATRAPAVDAEDVLLVVEVLSPSNRANDLVLKRHEYAFAEIPDYWIVDDRAKTLTVLRLNKRKRSYEEAAVVRAGEPYKTDEPFALEIDPAELF
jgi:Uma2 family endonuclease